jgi:hypothetical protein
METLRAIAELDFDSYGNFEPHEGDYLSYVTLAPTPSGETAYITEDLSESRLLQVAQGFSTGTGPAKESGIVLACIPTSNHGTGVQGIGMSKDGFLELMEYFNIDYSLLHLIKLNMYGVHIFHDGSHSSVFFIANTYYELMWSFNAATSTSKGILVTRDHLRKPRSKTLSSFLEVLQLQTSRATHPLTLAFVALLDHTRWLDHSSFQNWELISRIERTTGHGPLGQTEHGIDKHGIDALTTTSRMIGSVNVNLATGLRYVDIAEAILALLEDHELWGDWHCSFGSTEKTSDYESINRSFHSTLKPLQGRINSRRSALQYVLERTRNQSSVVTALNSLVPFLYPSVTADTKHRSSPY